MTAGRLKVYWKKEVFYSVRPKPQSPLKSLKTKVLSLIRQTSQISPTKVGTTRQPVFLSICPTKPSSLFVRLFECLRTSDDISLIEARDKRLLDNAAIAELTFVSLDTLFTCCPCFELLLLAAFTVDLPYRANASCLILSNRRQPSQ